MGSAAIRNPPASDRRGRTPALENSGERPSLRPSETDDETRTVRNILPWRNMEKELAKRLAAKAAKGELSSETEKNPLLFGESHPPPPSAPSARAIHTPDSGVRAAISATPEELGGPLSYRVYTVADLNTRELQLQRMTVPPPPAPQEVSWSIVAGSAVAVWRAWRACANSPKPRPRALDVCRVPLAACFADLRAALRTLPFKKIALGGGVAVGSICLFLFAVLTVAELTDDMKPRGSSPATTSETTAAPAMMTAPAMTAPAPAPTVDPEPPPIELDDDVAPAPVKAKPIVRPLGKSKGKKAIGRGAEPTSI